MPTLRADDKQALARTSDAKFPRSVLTFLHSLGITLAAAVAHLYSGKPSNPLVLSGTSFCGASGPWVLMLRRVRLVSARDLIPVGVTSYVVGVPEVGACKWLVASDMCRFGTRYMMYIVPSSAAILAALRNADQYSEDRFPV
jgi:hypothetical protein